MKVGQSTLELLLAILLGTSGALKLFSSFSSVPLMFRMDPIFIMLRNDYLFFFVGVLEIGVSLLLLSNADSNLKQMIAAWLAGCFSVYRLGWWLNGIKGPCPCLGSGYDWWPWLNDNQIQISLIGYIVFVSGMFLMIVFTVARKYVVNVK